MTEVPMTQSLLLPRWIFSFASKRDAAPEPVPEDLSTLSNEQLAALEARLVEEFNPLYDGLAELEAAEQPAAVARINELGGDIERVRGEQATRTEAATELLGEAEAVAARVRGAETPAEETPEETPTEAPAVAAGTETDTTATTVPVAAASEPAGFSDEQVTALGTAVGTALAPALEAIAAAAAPMTVPAEDLLKPKRLNVPLSEMRRRAPAADAPEALPQWVITAAADLQDFSAGTSMEGLDQVAEAMAAKARKLRDPSGEVPIASIEKTHQFSLSENSTPEQIAEIIRQATNPEVLVAAGGWCAPSEILYDFFNIADEGGPLDLPSTGITRGGIKFPTSLTLADVLGDVWTWTEADDIAAVTGTGTKPCVRVPCPTFTEVRLDCDGLCITAGNLTERAYPEMHANFVRLVLAAHFHAMNRRKINALVAGSTAVSTTTNNLGVVAPLLNSAELQAIDYRAKFGMRSNVVLEAVLPFWATGLIRADLARRRGSNDMLSVSDAEIAAWFDRRNVRVQWVDDYQVRTSGLPGYSSALLAWPSTIDFLLYAAGTWLLGDGPTIDLGVVRDSALNAKNDHTAAWSEECWLIAKPGHESRKVTVDVCPDGSVGPDATITCPIV